MHLLGAPAVAEQALQIPNETLRDDWIYTAAVSMGHAGDWKSATLAVQRLAAGTERDALTLRVAAEALGFEPETAAALFEATPGGHQRMMEEAGKWIASANRVGAEKWIRSSTVLSDEERSALLEKLPAGVTGTAGGNVPMKARAARFLMAIMGLAGIAFGYLSGSHISARQKGGEEKQSRMARTRMAAPHPQKPRLPQS